MSRSVGQVVASLRAAGETTRLRILSLLKHGELSVTELAQALGQSQPRVSRHLRLMGEAGLIDRAQEGAWVFCRLPPEGAQGRVLAEAVVGMVDEDDPLFAPDLARLKSVRATRDAAALAYFERSAKVWDQLRALHVPESAIEDAMLQAAGAGPFDTLVDVGVGAGRMLAVFGPLVRRAIGLDTSVEMLAVARAALDEKLAGKVELRLGDILSPSLPAASADLVTIHQVLHFLADPGMAIGEAVKLLRPGGRLLIADFLPHTVEFLREDHAHRRLGFAVEEVSSWCAAAGAPVQLSRALRPAGEAADGLTVQLWMAQREGTAPPIKTRATVASADPGGGGD